VLRALLVSLFVLACGNADTNPSTKSNAQRASDAPIPCETDEDCPPIACGPCTPGEVLTNENSGFDCKMNPCVDGGAVCGANKVCVVRPGAKPRPPRDDAKPQ
jgi:hypothetical protein